MPAVVGSDGGGGGGGGLVRSKRQYFGQGAGQQRGSMSSRGSPRKCERRTRLEDFQLGKLIGTGSSGTVISATRLSTGEKVAVKAISKHELCSSKRLVWYLRREVAIHKSLKDVEGVVGLQEVFEDGDAVYMVMELLAGGDVFWNMETICGGVDERVALEILRQVLEVLVLCHGKNLSHRDLKLENLVFCERPDLREGTGLKLKVVDWGLACMRDVGGVSGERVGTLRYCAPEILGREKYKPIECDMYSLGVVLYTLLMKRCPFDGKNEKEMLKSIWRERELDWGERKNISVDTKNLIRRLLSRHPANRPTAKEALDMVVKIQIMIKRQAVNGNVSPLSCAQELLEPLTSCGKETIRATCDVRPRDDEDFLRQPLDMLGMAFNKFFGLFNGGNDKKSEVCT